MNLADPELELIDPTPNVHNLFVHFDELFFWTKLKSRVVVRWSKRMYSCAGICSYEGRGGVCDIALSEPLLKLRPRKDLIETLLHEMIHAFLFITNRDNNRDGHGPNFQAHMHRINKAAGLNISIYHDFHDEVKLYLKHWWRCNGRCQKLKPFFGIVRRPLNRAPGPNDYWWENHRRMCGGTFIKIKEPQKPEKVTKKSKSATIKTNADITKYINNNNTTIQNKNIVKSINKENNVTNISVKTTIPAVKKSPEVRNILDSGRQRTNSASVVETVRNVWANKQIPPVPGSTSNSVKSNNVPKLMKHKTNSVQIDSPPKKMKKIDDYFKNNASSILKGVYGEEFIISQSHKDTKLIAVSVGQSSRVPILNTYVNCPSCNAQIYGNDINKHLDECLNKDIIEKLSKESIQKMPPPKTNLKVTDRKTSKDFEEINNLSRITSKSVIKNENDKPKPVINIKNDDKAKLKSIVGNIKPIPPFKPKEDSTNTTNTTANSNREDLEFFNTYFTIPESRVSKMETVVIGDFNPLNIKSEPGTSKDNFIQKCPCCGDKINKPVELHLDECRGFSDNKTRPAEGVSDIEIITIDDDEDDRFDDSQTFNATGTKSPCPCCLKMIEIADMNDHLDVCLSM